MKSNVIFQYRKPCIYHASAPFFCVRASAAVLWPCGVDLDGGNDYDAAVKETIRETI